MANAFGMERVVTAVVEKGSAAANQMGKAGMGIFMLLFLFHLMEGAAELATAPSTCRLWHGKFWLRILLVAGLLAGYSGVVVGTVGKLQPTYMTAYAATWADVWESETAAIASLRQAEGENQDVKYTEVTASKAGKEDDSWTGKITRYAVDGILTGLGWLLAVLVGLLITVFILMEGFTALGLNMLLLAIGPVCLAFAAHPKTEQYAFAFLKAFLFMALLYMPLLGLAAQFAGVVMAQMTTFVGGQGLSYGDGSNIAVHYLWVIFGPCCAFAVVKAAPTFLGMVLGSGSGGAGVAYGIGVAAAQQAVRVGSGEAGTDAGAPPPPKPAEGSGSPGAPNAPGGSGGGGENVPQPAGEIRGDDGGPTGGGADVGGVDVGAAAIEASRGE